MLCLLCYGGVGIVERAANIGLEEFHPKPCDELRSVLPPPFDSLLVEEVYDGVCPAVVNGISLLPRLCQQGVVFPVVDKRAYMQTEHRHVVLVGVVYHALRVTELVLELECASAVAELREVSPCRVEPHHIERYALFSQSVNEVLDVCVVGFALVVPCPSAVRPYVQAVCCAWHHGRHACQLLVAVYYLLRLRAVDEVVVIVSSGR